MFGKILGAITKWMNALMGKRATPGVSGKPVSEGPVGAEKPQGEAIAEREVSTQELKDIGAKKGLVSKGGEISGKTISSARGLIKKFSLKNLLIALGILIFVSLALSQAPKLVSMIKNRGKEEPQTVVEPTPTPGGYQVYKPSVYAGDPEILKLEEEINIFDREVSSAVLKESTLNPPSLDFNINFKK